MRARVLSAYYLAMPLGAALGLGAGLGDRPGRRPGTRRSWSRVPRGWPLALLALVLPDPVRGTSEGVDEPSGCRLHERVGPSREDYIDLMVNSSYTYSVFGLAFSMFAIGGLVFWLPTFLMVVQEMPPARVSSWLGLTVPAAIVLGIAVGGWLADRYFADQSAGPVPRAGRGDARPRSRSS